MSNNLLKGVVKLTQEQFDTLKGTGTLTVGDETIAYSPKDTAYVVEDTVITDLANLETKVTNLETRVDALEADPFEVLFDRASTDENISFGYTGGWLGGVQRNFDLTKYTGLRFFATLGGMGAQYYVKLTNREKADFLMLASNSNASKLYFMKVNIPLALNRIQVAYTGTITINPDGTVERTQGTSGNTSHFLSRIEGYF